MPQTMINDRSIKINAWDIMFMIWYVTDACFNHTTIGIAGQALFLLYSLKELIIRQSVHINHTAFFFLLFCGVCWLNISNGNAMSPGTARFMLNVLLRNLVFLFFLYNYLITVTFDKLIRVFVISCLFGSAIMLLLNYSITGSIMMRDIEDSINGNLQAVNNAIAIGLLYATSNKESKRWLYISIVLFLFCILAGTKKAIIVLVIIAGGFVLMKNPRNFLGNIVKISALMIALYIILFEIPFFYDLIGNRFEGMLGVLSDSDDVDASTRTRSAFIELGMSYITLRPITGYGIDCFREIPAAYGTYSHNNYIELAFGVGIPGAIVYYLMYLIPLIKGLKNWVRANNLFVMLGVMICVGCLFADYGMVSYFDRPTYLRILMIVLFVNSVSYQEQDYEA